MSHVTHMNASCQIDEMSYVTYMNKHVTYMNESRHTYELVMAHVKKNRHAPFPAGLLVQARPARTALGVMRSVCMT